MAWYAHSVEDRPHDDWQPLSEHLVAVSRLAAAFASRFGAQAAASLAGMLHDLGKYTAKFQRRLEGGAIVDHASAGAREATALGLTGGGAVMAQILTHVIAGHHSGLADSADLKQRLSDPLETVDPIWREQISLDTTGLMPKVKWREPERRGFQLAFLGRMIFSCLIDADRTDTAAFEAKASGKTDLEEAWPSLSSAIDRLIEAFERHMEGFRPEGEINALRGLVLREVRAKASMPVGFFTLTVPTGGGKTLASLGFALDHARVHGLDRIIYAIPFTSVIDQTVDIFTQVLGGDVVLAHHSGVEPDTAKKEKALAEDPTKKLRLAMANWAAPVVVTTNVQFFESLFSHRPSRCRKLHSIARSVIVLDEAQTIPLHVLKPCLAALDELVLNYGCSIVICTATQPAIAASKFKGGLDISAERELAPDPMDLHRKLKRVTARRAGIMTDEAVLADLAKVSSGLVIVNTRGHALALFRKAKAAGLPDAIHLTTRQYPSHRRKVLAGVRKRLDPKQPQSCHVIATSLIEAGVDVDFEAVWRADAGLDSITQAAGRANREGRRDPATSIVTVFEPAEVKPPPEIRGFIADKARVGASDEDLLSLESIQRYFQEVYFRKSDGLDRLPLQGTNAFLKVLETDTFGISATSCQFLYRTVGESFRLISDGMAPIIIPRDEEALKALGELRSPDARAGSIARKLQPFIVQVPPRARHLLLAEGHAAFEASDRFDDQFCVLKTPKLYHERFGLLWETPEYAILEDYMF